MKIAMLLTQLEVGGAQTRVFQTADALRNLGHIVDVVFLYKARECFENEAKLVLSERKSLIQLISGFYQLYNELRFKSYDVLITNTAPANVIGAFVGKLAGVPVRLAWQTQPPKKVKFPVRFLDKIWGQIGVYSVIVANSNWTYTCFKNYGSRYRSRLKVITNGIKPRIDKRSKSEARNALGIPREAQVVLNVGRLSIQKGQGTLIKAMKHLPGVSLYIVGEGELRKSLEKLVAREQLQSRIKFVGEVEGSVVATYFRASDVFAFPSKWETFGLALVEAAASGLPFVRSNLPVLDEVTHISDENYAGISVKLDDEYELASAIRDVLSNADLREQLTHSSSEIAKLHSLSTHVGKIETLSKRCRNEKY